jgi:hypothetical protein
MDIQSVLNSSFEHNLKENLDFITILLRLTLSAFFGYYISKVSQLFSLQKKSEPSILQAQFLLTFTSTATILVVGQNIAYAIGLFGALSFIRFRTILREPRDTVLFFFSATAGIALGAGQILLTSISSIFLTFILYILKKHINTNSHYYYLKFYVLENTDFPKIFSYFQAHGIKVEIYSLTHHKKSCVLRIYLSFDEILFSVEELKIEFPDIIRGYSIHEDKE